MNVDPHPQEVYRRFMMTRFDAFILLYERMKDRRAFKPDGTVKPKYRELASVPTDRPASGCDICTKICVGCIGGVFPKHYAAMTLEEREKAAAFLVVMAQRQEIPTALAPGLRARLCKRLALFMRSEHR